MWITSIIVNDNIDKELAYEHLFDFRDFVNNVRDSGSFKNDGVTLAPYDSRAKQFAAFAPGVVYRRAWNLESTARAAVDFVNNHSAGQITATFDGEQDV